MNAIPQVGYMTMHALLKLRAATTAMSFFVVAACGSTPLEVDELPEPDFSGTTTMIRQQGDILSVNIAPSASNTHERVVHVRPSTTLVIRERDGEYREVTTQNIVIGAILRVKTTGVEYRSLPPQYDATWIEIIPPLPE